MAVVKPFRYDTLLRVRQRQEDIKSMALAEMRRAVHFAEQQRAELVEQQLAALTAAGELARRQFDAGEVRRYYAYERHLARLAVEKDAEIRHLRTQERGRRTELETAMKRRKMLERLKERLEQAYDYVMNREERKRLDETAVNRAALADGPPKP
ncbi:MAG TPA: flagellar FliJ family protein [Candidatus Hydrogenedentes bacterium]|nr:flagellar FliJ family protein [Candidatus Hydrogenedentota bacterium]HPA06288.1 flagellar FliJ family protein [Candidatus Hydrogenedentota bacterium]HQM31597.1 flagellar FliJ family protein [Candidatus Hydrogenedentota bacterium]